MKIFLIRLIVFSGLVGIIDFCWNLFVPAYPIPHPTVIIIIYFIITSLFHYIITKNKDARPQVIVRYYMSGTVLRLFLYILILLLYRFIDKPTLVPFAIAFVLHYFLFTAFEVLALVRQFKNPSPPRSTNEAY
jgi:hypothetical protein